MHSRWFTFSRAFVVPLAALTIAFGCGESSDGTTPATARAPTSEPATSAARPQIAAAPAAAPATVADPAAAAPSIDLLHAVPTRVAVSSVYRDRDDQITRLFDGDPATAWNSRSGDLVGAWIEIDVPRDATVAAIALVPGFARTSADSDLFTGNHRIARVRISCDGTPLGEHALDPSSRELQEIPVATPGGILRIEVLETVPGTHADWQEICVSELRVLGRPAPGAVAGAVTPTTSAGTALAPSVEGGASSVEDDADPAMLDAEEALVSIDSAMDAFVRVICNAGDQERDVAGRISMTERGEIASSRRSTFDRVAAAIESRDPDRAAALRAHGAPDEYPWDSRVRAVTELLAAGDVLASALPSSGRCEWAETRTGVRLTMLDCSAREAESEAFLLSEETEDDLGRPMGREMRDQRRAMRATAEAFTTWLDRDDFTEWDTIAPHAERMLQSVPEIPSSVREDWEAARADLEALRAACGR